LFCLLPTAQRCSTAACAPAAPAHAPSPPQKIEHLRWKKQQLVRHFSYEDLGPSAADWLGREQLDQITHSLELR
jgi:hypothetical protein